MQIYIFYDISRSIKNWSCCTGCKDFNGSELSDMFGNPAEDYPSPNTSYKMCFGLGKLNPGPLEPSAMPTEPRTQKPAQQIVLPSTTTSLLVCARWLPYFCWLCVWAGEAAYGGCLKALNSFQEPICLKWINQIWSSINRAQKIHHLNNMILIGFLTTRYNELIDTVGVN